MRLVPSRSSRRGGCRSAAADGGPVLSAAKEGAASDVRRALAEAGDPNEVDADGTTALHWAVHRGDLASAMVLLAVIVTLLAFSTRVSPERRSP